MHECIVDGIDPAGDDHFTASRCQLKQSHVDGPHGTCAGGVHHTVGAAQIQTVGNPAGDNVAQKAGEGILLPANIPVGDLSDHLCGLIRRHPGFVQGLFPQWMPQAGTQWYDQFLGAGDSQNNAGPGAVEGFAAFAVSCVFQCALGGQEAQQL